MKKPWFDLDTDSIFEGESDGQTFKRAYSRLTDEGWEYALATYSDGEGNLISWIEIKQGEAIEHGE